MITLFLSVCAPFCHYNSKTITSIKLKFGGQILPGVQTNSSKLGVICLKSNSGESFSHFQLGIYIEI